MGRRAIDEARESARGYLRRLANGEEVQSEASDWAADAMEALESESVDPKTWRMLDLLLGADLKTSPTSYLYGREDFIAWRDEFAG